MSDSEERILQSVIQTGEPFEVIEIDPDFSDTKAFCETYNYPPENTCNTIIVTSRKGPKKSAACVILANSRLDVNKRVKNLLGVPKASFASPEEMMTLTGMEIGGVTPFSLPADLPLYIDQRVMDVEWVILGGGSRRIKIKTHPRVLLKVRGEIISDLAILN
jgi:prolyl-tRNA editing enzyme YbaK/EbsC (Cys-tRNA(Pro) deacylase)